MGTEVDSAKEKRLKSSSAKLAASSTFPDEKEDDSYEQILNMKPFQILNPKDGLTSHSNNDDDEDFYEMIQRAERSKLSLRM
jgi:hypothetical protein